MKSKPRRPLSFIEEVRFILEDETVYAIKLDVPEKPAARGGRSRIYPDYMVAVYGALVWVFRSARRVEVELAQPGTWRTIRKIVRRRFPDDPSLWLPREPMRRHHFAHMKRLMLRAGSLEKFRADLTPDAAALALEMGLMDPSSGSMTHPSMEQEVVLDGKVLTPICRARPGDVWVDTDTGEIRPMRCDEDAFLQGEGGREGTVYGTKFALATTRNEIGRVVLDVGHVSKDSGGEAQVMLNLLDEILPRLPGCRVVAVDGAWHGVHIQHVMTEHGVLSVAPVTAAKVATATEPRVPKEWDVEVRHVDTGKGKTERVKIKAVDGMPGVEILNSEGVGEFHPLHRVRIICNQNKGNRKYRLYQEYTLPALLGGASVILRLDGSPTDDGGINARAENLRAIPPGDPDFDILYGRRADIESLNRDIENRLYWNRAHSIGAGASCSISSASRGCAMRSPRASTEPESRCLPPPPRRPTTRIPNARVLRHARRPPIDPRSPVRGRVAPSYELWLPG